MRIALIVPGGVDRSGSERVIPVLLNLIERLARRHEVIVVALEQEPEACRYHLLGAKVANLGKVIGLGRAGQWVVRLRRLVSALRREFGRFDVIHAFWARGAGSLAVAAGCILRVPVVVTIGGGELIWLSDIGYGGQGSWIGRAETSLVLHTAQAVTAGSRYVLETCAHRLSHAEWLPLGVDLRRLAGTPERPPGPPWRLLHVASLNLVKDQRTLLEAMCIVLRKNPLVQLDCIGTDTLNGYIQHTAGELGLERNIRFHGFKPLDEIVPLYRQAHLYVQSSLHESMGASVLEAAAAGVPTVGTAVGLVAEMAPEAAVAVPVREPAVLAEAIIGLLDNSLARVHMARAAQRFAQAFNADWTAARCEAVYSKICSGHRQSTR